MEIISENHQRPLFRASPGGLRSQSIMRTQFGISVSWLEVINWIFTTQERKKERELETRLEKIKSFLIFLTLESVSLPQQNT